MDMGDTLMLSSVPVPEGVEFLDDVEETVVATVILPTIEEEPEEVEEETELVGEDGEPIEGEAAEGEGGDASEESGGDSGDSGDE